MTNFTCFILKSAESEEASVVKDRYIEFLAKHPHDRLTRVVHLNPLRFERVNQHSIHTALGPFFLTDQPNTYKALILTSCQTVECIEKALLSEQTESVDSAESCTVQISDSIDNHQDKMIVYCVGQATLNRFVRLVSTLRQVNSSLEGKLIVRMAEKLPASTDDQHRQNAQHLAHLVEADFRSIGAPQSKFAFYPCSNIRKDDLAKHLTAVGVDFEELCVYRTTTNEKNMSMLADELDTLVSIEPEELICFVFFSPSGVDAVWSNDRLRDIIVKYWTRLRFVSIGPSTSQRLRQLDVNQVPNVYELSKPSPENLLAKFDDIN